jgi:DNA-binding winged helix-turn-helix (wHTH) protein
LGPLLDEPLGGFRELNVGVWVHILTSEFPISRSVTTNGLHVASDYISRSAVAITRVDNGSYTIHNRTLNPEYVSLESIFLNSQVGMNSDYDNLDDHNFLEPQAVMSMPKEGVIDLKGLLKIKFHDPGGTLTDTIIFKDGLVVSTVEDNRQAWLQGHEKRKRRLSDLEWKFLLFLIRQGGKKYVSREEIARNVWEIEEPFDPKSMDASINNTVKRLRADLLFLDNHHEYIENQRNKGYRFNKQPFDRSLPTV